MSMWSDVIEVNKLISALLHNKLCSSPQLVVKGLWNMSGPKREAFLIFLLLPDNPYFIR